MNAPLTRHRRQGYIDLRITGMTCAACAARIEKALNRLPGVVSERQPGHRVRARARRTRSTTRAAA